MNSMATSSKDLRFPVPPDPLYGTETGGATQGDFAVDILGRRIGSTGRMQHGRQKPGRLTEDGRSAGVERALDEILDELDREPRSVNEIRREQVNAVGQALAHGDVPGAINMMLTWALIHEESNIRMKWQNALVLSLPDEQKRQLFPESMWRQLGVKETAKERRERIAEAIRALPPGISNREAERLLRARGFKVSRETIRKLQLAV
jgi:hypothetical protein